MKRSAFLINVSRGDLIDEAALAEACRAGQIAGAGLDVTRIEPLPSESELWRLDNVVLTPHIGGAGSDQLERLLDAVAENLARFIRGEPLLRPVAC
jgi:glycerate dehydrogenase